MSIPTAVPFILTALILNLTWVSTLLYYCKYRQEIVSSNAKLNNVEVQGKRFISEMRSWLKYQEQLLNKPDRAEELNFSSHVSTGRNDKNHRINKITLLEQIFTEAAKTHDEIQKLLPEEKNTQRVIPESFA